MVSRTQHPYLLEPLGQTPIPVPIHHGQQVGTHAAGRGNYVEKVCVIAIQKLL